MTKRFGIALFSVASHLTAGITILVLSLVSADTMPAPHRVLAFTFDERVVRLPRDIELPPQVRARTTNAPNAGASAVPVTAPAAPVVAPRDVQPETLLNVSTADVRSNAGVHAIESGGSGTVEGVGVAELPPPAAPPVTPIRLHSGIVAPRKIHEVLPIYPATARSLRLEGMVILEAVIGVDGRVESARVLRSLPLLDEAALGAVRQWRFAPARLNNEVVPVVMTVTINFSLH